MGDKKTLIRSYIASLIQNYLPKHEETIHSALFLALNAAVDRPKLFDWYFNGYSVISETISSHLQYLCKTNFVEYSNDGSYYCGDVQKHLTQEILEKASSELQSVLSEYQDGFQIINEAIKIFNSSV